MKDFGNCSRNSNGNGDGTVVTGLDYTSVGQFFDRANEREFKWLAEKIVRQGYKFFRERQISHQLPMLERLTKRVSDFKNDCANRAAVLAAFCVTYGSGGRTQIRDAVNCFFSFVSANISVFEELTVKFVLDIIRGKKYTEVIEKTKTSMTNIVRDIRKDPANIVAIRLLLCELKDAFSANVKDLLADDPMEFPGTIDFFDESGNVRSFTAMQSELNVKRCAHMRESIVKLLSSVKNRYSEAYTCYLKNGLSHEDALIEVEKKLEANIPSGIPTEKTLKKQIASENYAELCDLYNTLKRDWL